LALPELAKLGGLEQAVTGTLGADLKVVGSLFDPEVRGRLQANDVSLGSDTEAQPWFKDLALDVQFQGRNAEVDLAVDAPPHLQWRPVAPARLSWDGLEQLLMNPS